MYCDRKSQLEISQHLERLFGYRISQQQISDDIKVIRGQWLKQAAESITQRQADELAKIDHLESKFIDGYERSQRQRTRTEQERWSRGVAPKEQEQSPKVPL